MTLLIFTGSGYSLFAQQNINGIVNLYGAVNSIGTDYVIVDDESQFQQFHAKDTVLLIQMKGVIIYGEGSASPYGDSNFSYGEAGKHEFLTILSVDDPTNTITFRNNIKYVTFDPGSSLQIIKVRSYSSAIVEGGTLSCAPWNSTTKTGGVLAVIVGNTLTLNNNIDVSGKGFTGGPVTGGMGICRTTEADKWGEDAYSQSSDSAGFKGESLSILVDPYADNTPPYYPVFPFNAKGQGKNFNGGGGGNGKFSGGGGGSNYGMGGNGGSESNTCTPSYNGGLGGISIFTTGLNGGLFMGGGGGSSTVFGVGSPTAGANGGGLIILLCDTLKGNGNQILANGDTPSGISTGNAGAGGGGGGGSIALYVQSYSTSTLKVYVKGGNGGDNDPLNSLFGEGGGGGGGFVATNASLPGNVEPLTTGGLVGKRKGGSTGTGGSTGKVITGFAPTLNGFLLNSITSSVTGTQIDSICSNVIPKKIMGTQPTGTGPFSYLWQKSYNLALLPSDIAGATSKDYTPAATEANTFWIRRVVTDVVTSNVDTSKWVNIIVQPAITGNMVGKDTTICYDQNPLNLIPLNSGPSNGNGHYSYQWVQNTDNLTWTNNATGADSSLSSFDPPSLKNTTFFQRVVTSGRCVDNSPTVTITVLPLITGNQTSRTDSIICEGSLFDVLGASPAGAGSGSYVYQWQDSITSSTWQPATGININLTYTPDTLQFATIEHRFFRRVVYSGPDNVCRNNSLPIEMTRWHKIENNTISSPDNMICSGEIPAPLTATGPINGDGTYTYEWQDSSKITSWTTRLTSGTPYSPPSLTDTTWYKRIVNSSVCTSTSNKIVIIVHDPIASYNIAADTTICSGAVPMTLRGQSASGGNGLFAYQWYYSDDNFVTQKIPVPVTGTIEDLTPVALNQDTWYMREVTSGECFETSNQIKVTILQTIGNNIITPAKTDVCYNTIPGLITGGIPTGGAGAGSYLYLWQDSTDGVSWNTASGTSNQQNYTPVDILSETIWFRRIVTSGPASCCTNISAVVMIDTITLPTGSILPVSDTTICSDGEVKIKLNLTGYFPWIVTYRENLANITEPATTFSDYTITRKPSVSAGLTSFAYTLVNVEDKNGCLATSLTGLRNSVVYRVPVANAGPDDEICGPEYTFSAVPSDGTGTWTWEPSAPVLAPFPTNYNGSVIIDSSFTAANVTYKFYWEEKNWNCTSKDSVRITFSNRIDIISAGADTAIFTFDNRMKLNAYPIQSYETGLWSVVTGDGNFDNSGENSTFVKNIATGLNTYKWLVSNGLCTLEDLINIDVTNAIIPEGISPDGDLVNDTLIIKGLNLEDQLVDMTIISGAGVKVFTASNRDGSWANWDGKNSKGIELPEGTYYYLLKVESPNTGIVLQKSGFIILKRH